MNVCYRILLYGMVVFLASSVYAQMETRYYLSYEDFIRGIDTSPSQVAGKPFFRAQIEAQRAKRLDYILPDGSLSSFTNFYYDNYGNLVVKDTFTADSLLLSRTSYQPDEVQSMMLEKIHGRDWVSSQKDYFTICTFDSIGNPVKYEIKAASGEDVGRLEYRYNDRNDLIMEIWIRARDNKVIELSDFHFDYQNSVQYITQYDSSGLEVSKISLQLPGAATDSTQH